MHSLCFLPLDPLPDAGGWVAHGLTFTILHPSAATRANAASTMRVARFNVARPTMPAFSPLSFVSSGATASTSLACRLMSMVVWDLARSVHILLRTHLVIPFTLTKATNIVAVVMETATFSAKRGSMLK